MVKNYILLLLWKVKYFGKDKMYISKGTFENIEDAEISAREKGFNSFRICKINKVIRKPDSKLDLYTISEEDEK